MVILKSELVALFKEKFGITEGMSLLFYSNYENVGPVEGGPATVIETLKEIITEQGILIIPSFSDVSEMHSKGYYDPEETPTKGDVIAEYFWRMDDVERSLDPLYSFAAWGKNADDLLLFHHQTLSFGVRSPLGVIGLNDGYGLLFGSGYQSNPFHHVVETYLESPCLGCRTEAYRIKIDNKLYEGRTTGWRNEECPINDAGLYELFMERANVHKSEPVGESRAIFFKLKDCFDIVAPCLKNGFGAHAPCCLCLVRPRNIDSTVKGDWDRNIEKPRADSESWRF